MSKAKILVADDDPNVVKLLEETLSERNYKVIQTGDGEAVIPKAIAEHPDLIILDIMLPNLGGFQICEKLRNIRETKKIPVLVVSAHTSRQLILNLHSIGYNNYLGKPFNVTDLIDRVEYLAIVSDEDLIH